MADDRKSAFVIFVDEKGNRNEKYHLPAVNVQDLRGAGGIRRPVVLAVK